MDLLTICESVKARASDIAADIIDRWDGISVSEPWLELPEQLNHDHLPELVLRLGAASLCTDFDRDLCREVMHTAAKHGERRRTEGYGESLVHREYHLLRRTLAERIKREYGETSTVFLAMMRMDALTTLAIAAALHGFHRSDLAERGVWPDVIDRLLDEWPLPRG